MNDQLSQALASVISQGAGALSSGITFLQSEIPDVIAQLLLWKLVWSGAKAIFFLAVVIACLRLFKFFYQKTALYNEACARIKRAKYGSDEWDAAKNDMDVYEDGSIAGYLGCTVCVLGLGIAGFGVFAQVGNVIQIWLAPKIYLIEYAASLAK
ncbi:hypothetical protein [Castellaniella sp.]|uniref:hypothetical protein n=1 Tax=Castellaniella sp. TaxID=1955812 RepID=UPI002AFDDDD4|nr:hypothetical protein [Castellaniella sp.]